MVSPAPNPPSWMDSFRNILGLEESRGFNDSAVVGGMDRFIQRWSQDMAGHLTNPELACHLAQATYSSMSPEARRDWAARWRSALAASPGASVSPGRPDARVRRSATAPQAGGAAAQTVSPEKPHAAHRSPPAGLTVDAPVSRLRGIDTKLSARLKRLEVESVRDLLYLFPRRHLDYSKFSKISELVPGEQRTVEIGRAHV